MHNFSDFGVFDKDVVRCRHTHGENLQPVLLKTVWSARTTGEDYGRREVAASKGPGVRGTETAEPSEDPAPVAAPALPRAQPHKQSDGAKHGRLPPLKREGPRLATPEDTPCPADTEGHLRDLAGRWRLIRSHNVPARADTEPGPRPPGAPLAEG